MVSKNQIKYITSLKQKKFRDEHNLFIAEGTKIVAEMLNSSINVKQIFATSDFLRNNKIENNIERFEIKENELERISSLFTANQVVALCEIPSYSLNIETLKDKLTLVLDEIKDPGNMGTIIRIADWFGIETIICSNSSADIYNPKVVQATMGSIARIKVHYTDLPTLLQQLSIASHPEPVEGQQLIYGALLDGENIYTKQLSQKGIIVIGNESKGISKEVESFITDRINIPSFSDYKSGGGEAESLNAAIATSIICSEFRRR